MAEAAGNIVLGSRSPRRLELLSLLVPRERIEVRPPRDSHEAGFDGLRTWAEIEARLLDIARAKQADVAAQLAESSSWAALLAADSAIVGQADGGGLAVLGQPPEAEAAREAEVRRWFRDYYFGKTHAAVTAVCVAKRDGRRRERLVKSRVTFAADGDSLLDWYLATGEPRGKAGGYALQEAGSIFVDRVEGSLSNIVGLPLRETFDALCELGVVPRAHRIIPCTPGVHGASLCSPLHHTDALPD
jgi:septum formation protein